MPIEEIIGYSDFGVESARFALSAAEIAPDGPLANYLNP